MSARGDAGRRTRGLAHHLSAPHFGPRYEQRRAYAGPNRRQFGSLNGKRRILGLCLRRVWVLRHYDVFWTIREGRRLLDTERVYRKKDCDAR
jgi:hypothetical protein